MFEKIQKFWNDYGFEVCVIGSIVIILFLALFRIGKKGTWDEYVDLQQYTKKNYRGPPKESKGEKECRRVLETLFQAPFPKCRPDILQNPVTSTESDLFNLELDCYNSRLRLAVEYNGVQHYKYSNFFHRNKEAFYNQRYRDYMKREMCKKNNITLIEVPYTIKVEDIKKFLIKELNNAGYNKWMMTNL